MQIEADQLDEGEDDGEEESVDGEEDGARQLPDIIGCAFFGVLDSIALMQTGDAAVDEIRYAGRLSVVNQTRGGWWGGGCA